MAQRNVQIAGATYSDVPGIEVPLYGEQGNAYFVDVSDTTAVAADVASGKYFYKADGTKDVGTGSQSGGVITITDTLDAAGGTIREITAHVGRLETWTITYRDGTTETETLVMEDTND